MKIEVLFAIAVCKQSRHCTCCSDCVVEQRGQQKCYENLLGHLLSLPQPVGCSQ